MEHEIGTELPFAFQTGDLRTQTDRDENTIGPALAIRRAPRGLEKSEQIAHCPLCQLSAAVFGSLSEALGLFWSPFFCSSPALFLPFFILILFQS